MAYGTLNVDKIRESSLDAFMVQGNVLAQHNNLVCKYVTAATVDIDADAILLLNSTSGDGYKAETVNLTVDISTGTGANTLDTGAEASATCYYLWVIYNPDTTTVAGLLSTSSTAPTMPSGYTYKGLVGAVYNDSGSDFDNFHQVGNSVGSLLVSVLSNGGAASFTSVDLSVVVPPLAKQVTGAVVADDPNSTATNLTLAGTAAGLGEAEWREIVTAITANRVPFRKLLLESQVIYYKMGDTTENGDIEVSGWEY